MLLLLFCYKFQEVTVEYGGMIDIIQTLNTYGLAQKEQVRGDGRF